MENAFLLNWNAGVYNESVPVLALTVTRENGFGLYVAVTTPISLHSKQKVNFAQENKISKFFL